MRVLTYSFELEELASDYASQCLNPESDPNLLTDKLGKHIGLNAANFDAEGYTSIPTKVAVQAVESWYAEYP